MPTRPVVALIVLFWVATLGWFGYREVWPRLRPGESPPFVIEIGDEVTSQLPDDKLRSADALWTIYRGDKPVGKAQTRLRYIKEDRTYELQNRVLELQVTTSPFVDIYIPEMINTYRIDERGELKGIKANGEMRMRFLGAKFKGAGTFEGIVNEGKLERRAEITLEDFDPIVPKLDPVDAPRGTFLNPLHPVPRIRGLKPGRVWRMQVINPLGEVVAPAIQAIQDKFNPGAKPIELKLPKGPAFLNAEVLTETAMIPWNNVEHECLIIEFRGENERLRTYVRKSDGAVLRQESEALGERFYLQRY